MYDTIRVAQEPEEPSSRPETPNFAEDMDSKRDSSIAEEESDQSDSADEDDDGQPDPDLAGRL